MPHRHGPTSPDSPSSPLRSPQTDPRHMYRSCPDSSSSNTALGPPSHTLPTPSSTSPPSAPAPPPHTLWQYSYTWSLRSTPPSAYSNAPDQNSTPPVSLLTPRPCHPSLYSPPSAPPHHTSLSNI